MAPHKYATLVSVDGHEYIVPLEACYASPMLSAAVGKDARFMEGGTNRIKLPTIRSVSLNYPKSSRLCRTCPAPLYYPPGVDDETKLPRCVSLSTPTEPFGGPIAALHERLLHLT